VLTLAVVQQKIKDLDIGSSNEKKYLDDIKRVMKMAKCDDLVSCLNKHKMVIKLIKEAKMANGEPYAINTLKSAFQAILFVIDRLKLNIDKKPYDEQFQILKVASAEQTAHRVETEAIPLWKDYLEKCKKKYGMESRQYLLARLYNELTVRDDYGLVLSKEPREDNYLLIEPDGLEVVINAYKTDKRYGQIRYKLKGSLEKMTREYIAKRKLKVGDFLFGRELLSPVLSKMNADLGYKTGVNLFRHMTTSEELLKAKTPEERVKLAAAMKHSPVVQLSYLRKKKLV